jgi:hypothetical protein
VCRTIAVSLSPSIDPIPRFGDIDRRKRNLPFFLAFPPSLVHPSSAIPPPAGATIPRRNFEAGLKKLRIECPRPEKGRDGNVFPQSSASMIRHVITTAVITQQIGKSIIQAKETGKRAERKRVKGRKNVLSPSRTEVISRRRSRKHTAPHGNSVCLSAYRPPCLFS